MTILSLNNFFNPEERFGKLKILYIKVFVELTKNAQLPSFLGFAWRGLLGHSLRQLICLFHKQKTCKNCEMQHHCPYFQLFELGSTISGFSSTVRGYVFYSQNTHNLNVLEIKLFGKTAQYIYILMAALRKAQKIGLGAERVRFEIKKVVEVCPDGQENILSFEQKDVNIRGPFPLLHWLDNDLNSDYIQEIKIVSPVRLRQKGKYLTRMDWPFFFFSLTRRLEMLNVFFNDGEILSREEWQGLKEIFKQVKVDKEELHWLDLKRYSSRQRKKIPLGGLVGRVYLNTVSSWWLKWWQLASLVHVGKGAGMGLGKIVY